MGLSEQANSEVGRLLNGTNNLQHAAIGHLASAAGRAAESLVYLADIDDLRFGSTWPIDAHSNDAVDDGHVRWAASTALTSLDLCMAAASRLGGFSKRPPNGEDSIRDFYSVTFAGKIKDDRHIVVPPWRAWIDAIVADPRYETLLRVRNVLVHADALRIVHATSGALSGHSLRYGYNIGPLVAPAHPSTHTTISARDIVVLSREVALEHVGAFVVTLRSLSRNK